MNNFLKIIFIFCLLANPFKLLAEESVDVNLIEVIKENKIELLPVENINLQDLIPVIQEQNIQEISTDKIIPVISNELEIKDIETDKVESDNFSSENLILQTFEDKELSQKVLLHIKKDSQEIFSGEVEINDSILDILDNKSIKHSIKNNSVLSIIYNADLISENFSISDLVYYDSFDSFYLNCLNVPSLSDSGLCYNWQFVVNDQYPSVGMDKKILQDKDEVYIYFGSPKKITLPEFATTTLEFKLVVEKYNYVDNTWSYLDNYTVGLLKEDPLNPWNPIEIVTSSIDENGQAKFVVSEEGNYKIGLKEDWYYPAYDIFIKSINNIFSSSTIDSTTTATTTSTSTNSSTTTNSSGKNSEDDNSKINLESAINFLLSNQNSNGSFGADLYTDWVAIGLSANNKSNSNLKNYISNRKINSNLLDNLRLSMAMLALKIDPQKIDSGNLIKNILHSFDGSQFGENGIFNDDIFSILVLQNIGFNYSDKEISATIDYILSNQNSDGSFGGIDLTAACVQALQNFSFQSKINDSIKKAKNYLKNSQMNDGGWGDVYSTAWVVMAINSLGESESSWMSSEQKTPFNYLAENQDKQDGGFLKSDSISNRIWATAYIIGAVSGKDWSNIMANFSKIIKDQENVADLDKIDKELLKKDVLIENSSTTTELIKDTEEELKEIESKENVAKTIFEIKEEKQIQKEIKDEFVKEESNYLKNDLENSQVANVSSVFQNNKQSFILGSFVFLLTIAIIFKYKF